MKTLATALILFSLAAHAADPMPSDAPTLVVAESGEVTGEQRQAEGEGKKVTVALAPGDLCLNKNAAEKVNKYVVSCGKEKAGLQEENEQLRQAIDAALVDPPVRPGPIILVGVAGVILGAVVAGVVVWAVKK